MKNLFKRIFLLLFIISFSNRAFWSKATRVWVESSDDGRIKYIRDVLIANGWSSMETISELRFNNDMLSFLGIHKDPFFSVIASK